jgi:fatty acid desaturase
MTEPDDPLLDTARRDVRRLRDFYSLVGTALLLTALTAVINWVTSPGRWWFLWVVFGFGVAIAFAAFDLWVRRRWLGPDWERRQVERRLGELRR